MITRTAINTQQKSGMSGARSTKNSNKRKVLPRKKSCGTRMAYQDVASRLVIRIDDYFLISHILHCVGFRLPVTRKEENANAFGIHLPLGSESRHYKLFKPVFLAA